MARARGLIELALCCHYCIDNGVARVYFFTDREALAEFQHVNCMIVQIWEVKRVAC